MAQLFAEIDLNPRKHVWMNIGLRANGTSWKLDVIYIQFLQLSHGIPTEFDFMRKGMVYRSAQQK